MRTVSHKKRQIEELKRDPELRKALFKAAIKEMDKNPKIARILFIHILASL